MGSWRAAQPFFICINMHGWGNEFGYKRWSKPSLSIWFHINPNSMMDRNVIELNMALWSVHANWPDTFAQKQVVLGQSIVYSGTPTPEFQGRNQKFIIRRFNPCNNFNSTRLVLPFLVDNQIS
jgi:hypothetical protein